MEKRDVQLDMYRAISIMYVVCVVHVLYWWGIGKEPIISMILIEMPAIFFVSGAAQSLKKDSRPLAISCWSRIKRVLIPYYIYAVNLIVIMFVLSIIWLLLYDNIVSLIGEKLAQKYKYDIFTYNMFDIWDVISCSNIPQAHFVFHLWFIILI